MIGYRGQSLRTEPILVRVKVEHSYFANLAVPLLQHPDQVLSIESGTACKGNREHEMRELRHAAAM